MSVVVQQGIDFSLLADMGTNRSPAWRCLMMCHVS